LDNKVFDVCVLHSAKMLKIMIHINSLLSHPHLSPKTIQWVIAGRSNKTRYTDVTTDCGNKTNDFSSWLSVKRTAQKTV